LQSLTFQTCLRRQGIIGYNKNMNLWHDVEPGTKEAMNVIVEINKGSKNKYEIDKQTGLIALDRVMHTAQDYPFDYGFVPRSLWHDDDPLDVVLLTSHSLVPGVLVRARPVALMNMIDSGDADDKIIAVPAAEPRFDDVHDLGDVNPHVIKEMEHFFSTYKKLQNKEVEVTGFKGKKEAQDTFVEGLELYTKEFQTK
jgi:inorganic pyrophosphatase